MSWSPRAFARLTADWGGERVWLTADAAARIREGLRVGAIEIPPAFTVPENMHVGFRDGVTMGGLPFLGVSLAPTGLCLATLDMVVRMLNVSESARNATADLFTECTVAQCFGEGGRAEGRLYSVKVDALGAVEDVTVVDGYGPNAGTRTAPRGSADHAALELALAAAVLFTSPTERGITATTATRTAVATGPKKTGPRARPVDVSVIDVRAPIAHTQSATGTGRAPVEHDHRWTRRGHYRMQPFGPGRGQRRKQWIWPQVCGPEDKPLLTRPKVHVLR